MVAFLHDLIFMKILIFLPAWNDVISNLSNFIATRCFDEMLCDGSCPVVLFLTVRYDTPSGFPTCFDVKLID